MPEPMNISDVQVKIGASTWIVWAGALLSVAIAVIDAVKGESANAVWLTAISAGLVAINNIVRSWQATAATNAGADASEADTTRALREASAMWAVQPLTREGAEPDQIAALQMASQNGGPTEEPSRK